MNTKYCGLKAFEEYEIGVKESLLCVDMHGERRSNMLPPGILTSTAGHVGVDLSEVDGGD